MGLGDPRAYHGGISARVQARAVAADLGVILADAFPGGFGPAQSCGVVELGRLPGEDVERRVDVRRANISASQSST
jgi:hypothetical protein